MVSSLWLNRGRFLSVSSRKRICSTKQRPLADAFWTGGAMGSQISGLLCGASGFIRMSHSQWQHPLCFYQTPSDKHRASALPGTCRGQRGPSWKRQNKHIFHNNYSGYQERWQEKLLTRWWKDLWLGSSKVWQVSPLMKNHSFGGEKRADTLLSSWESIKLALLLSNP